MGEFILVFLALFNINRKVIAFVLAACFLAEQAAWAVPSAASFSHPIPPIPSAGLSDIIREPDRLNIPADRALLKSSHAGSSGKLIIHIQDAHANYSGQLNIAGTLDHLMKRYPELKIVMTEGGSGECALTPLRQLAPLRDWKRSAKKLLMRGTIDGIEYLNLTTEYPMRIVGVEEDSLYEKNLEAYARLKRSRGRMTAYLHQIRTAIQKIKAKRFPSALLDYESLEGSDALIRLQALVQLARESGVEYTGFDAVEAFAALKAFEGALDFDRLNEEQDGLLRDLADELGADDWSSEQGGESKAAVSSRIGRMEKWIGLARRRQIPPRKYQEYFRYCSYLKAFESMDIDRLLSEQNALEQKVYHDLLADPALKTIHTIDRYVGLLGKACGIRLTHSEFDEFRKLSGLLPTVSWQAFLNKKLEEQKDEEDWIPYDEGMIRVLGELREFYSLVQRRDLAFVRHMEASLRESKVVVLVTGGYHSEHLTQLFRSAGHSYAVLAPVIGHETDERKYEDLLLNSIRSNAHHTLDVAVAASRIDALVEIAKEIRGRKPSEVRAAIERITSRQNGLPSEGTLPPGARLAKEKSGAVPVLKKDEYAIAGRALAQIFYGTPTKLMAAIHKRLPHVRSVPSGEIERDGISFFERSFLRRHRWAVKKKDLKALGEAMGFIRKEDVPQVKDDEISVTGRDFGKRFMGYRNSLAEKAQKLLPDPEKHKANTAVFNGATFLKRSTSGGRKYIWAFKEKAIAKVAKALGFVVRPQGLESYDPQKELVVSPSYLGDPYIGNEGEIYQKFSALLPDPVKHDADTFEYGGIRFVRKRGDRMGTSIHWTFSLRDKAKAGKLFGVAVQGDVPFVQKDEIGMTNKWFMDTFVISGYAIKGLILSKLPNLDSFEGLEQDFQGVTFYKRRVSNVFIWAFKRKDKSKIADIFEAEVRSEDIDLADENWVAVSHLYALKETYANVKQADADRIRAALPNPKTYREDKFVQWGIRFLKKKRGKRTVWAFKKTPTNVKRLARAQGLFPKQDLELINPEKEVGVVGPGLKVHFEGISHHSVLEVQSRLPKAKKEGEPVVTVKGITFYKRVNVIGGYMWAFPIGDMAKFSEAFGFRLKENILDLAEEDIAVTGMGLSAYFYGKRDKLPGAFQGVLPEINSHKKKRFKIGKVEFYKRRIIGKLHWAFHKDSRREVAQQYRLLLLEDLKEKEPGEALVSPEGLKELFGRNLQALRLLAQKLPDPAESAEISIQRDGVIYTLRMDHQRLCWTFPIASQEAVARYLGINRETKYRKPSRGEILLTAPAVKRLFLGVGDNADTILNAHLPVPGGSAQDTILVAGTPFYLAQAKAGEVRWAIDAENLSKLAELLGLRRKDAVRKIRSNEVRAHGRSLTQRIKASSQEVTKALEALLPDPNESKSDTFVIGGVTFYLTHPGARLAKLQWAFDQKDIAKVAALLGFGLKVKLPKIKKNEIPITAASLNELFYAPKDEIEAAIQQKLNLPAFDESEQQTHQDGALAYRVRRASTLQVWAIPKSQLNVLADKLGLALTEPVAAVGRSEVFLTAGVLKKYLFGSIPEITAALKKKLPNPRTYAGRSHIQEDLSFHIRRVSKKSRVFGWAVSKTSLGELATFLGFELKAVIGKPTEDEVVMNAESLMKHLFVPKGASVELDRLIRTKLPDPSESKTASIQVEGIDFVLRRSLTKRFQPYWAAKISDIPNIAKLFGFVNRMDILETAKDEVTVAANVWKLLFEGDIPAAMKSAIRQLGETQLTRGLSKSVGAVAFTIRAGGGKDPRLYWTFKESDKAFVANLFGLKIKDRTAFKKQWAQKYDVELKPPQPDEISVRPDDLDGLTGAPPALMEEAIREKLPDPAKAVENKITRDNLSFNLRVTGNYRIFWATNKDNARKLIHWLGLWMEDEITETPDGEIPLSKKAVARHYGRPQGDFVEAVLAQLPDPARYHEDPVSIEGISVVVRRTPKDAMGRFRYRWAVQLTDWDRLVAKFSQYLNLPEPRQPKAEPPQPRSDAPPRTPRVKAAQDFVPEFVPNFVAPQSDEVALIPNLMDEFFKGTSHFFREVIKQKLPPPHEFEGDVMERGRVLFYKRRPSNSPVVWALKAAQIKEVAAYLGLILKSELLTPQEDEIVVSTEALEELVQEGAIAITTAINTHIPDPSQPGTMTLEIQGIPFTLRKKAQVKTNTQWVFKTSDLPRVIALLGLNPKKDLPHPAEDEFVVTVKNLYGILYQSQRVLPPILYARIPAPHLATKETLQINGLTLYLRKQSPDRANKIWVIKNSDKRKLADLLRFLLHEDILADQPGEIPVTHLPVLSYFRGHNTEIIRKARAVLPEPGHWPHYTHEAGGMTFYLRTTSKGPKQKSNKFHWAFKKEDLSKASALFGVPLKDAIDYAGPDEIYLTLANARRHFRGIKPAVQAALKKLPNPDTSIQNPEVEMGGVKFFLRKLPGQTKGAVAWCVKREDLDKASLFFGLPLIRSEKELVLQADQILLLTSEIISYFVGQSAEVRQKVAKLLPDPETYRESSIQVGGVTFYVKRKATASKDMGWAFHQDDLEKVAALLGTRVRRDIPELAEGEMLLYGGLVEDYFFQVRKDVLPAVAMHLPETKTVSSIQTEIQGIRFFKRQNPDPDKKDGREYWAFAEEDLDRVARLLGLWPKSAMIPFKDGEVLIHKDELTKYFVNLPQSFAVSVLAVLPDPVTHRELTHEYQGVQFIQRLGAGDSRLRCWAFDVGNLEAVSALFGWKVRAELPELIERKKREDATQFKALVDTGDIQRLVENFGVESAFRMLIRVHKFSAVNLSELFADYVRGLEYEDAAPFTGAKRRRLSFIRMRRIQDKQIMQRSHVDILADEIIRSVYHDVVADHQYLSKIKRESVSPQNGEVLREAYAKAYEFYVKVSRLELKGLDEDKIGLHLYQRAGVQKILDQERVILADDPGMGKTIQALAAALNANEGRGAQKTLIVAPKRAVKGIWEKEIRDKTLGPHSVVVVRASALTPRVLKKEVETEEETQARLKDERRIARKKAEIRKAKFVIVNYESIRGKENPLREYLKTLDFDFTIVDEAHRMRNESYQTSALAEFDTKYKVLVTGTPIVGRRIRKLFNLVHWLYPVTFSSRKQFSAKYSRSAEALRELSEVLKAFVIRRTKADHLNLPPVTEIKVMVDPEPDQRRLYETINHDFREWLRTARGGPGAPAIIAKLVRLKQACTDPSLLGDPEAIGVSSAKYTKMDELVEAITAKGEKVVIFTEFRDVVSHIRSRYRKHGVNFLYGGMSHSAGQSEIDQFQNDPAKQIFVSTFQSGGEAISLNQANHVIFVNKPWNQQQFQQAIDRSHRIGQKNPVTVYSLIARGTVDEHIEQVVFESDVITRLAIEDDATLGEMDDSMIEKLLLQFTGGGNIVEQLKQIRQAGRTRPEKPAVPLPAPTPFEFPSFAEWIQRAHEADEPTRARSAEFIYRRLEEEAANQAASKDSILWKILEVTAPHLTRSDYPIATLQNIEVARLLLLILMDRPDITVEELAENIHDKNTLEKALYFLDATNLFKAMSHLGALRKQYYYLGELLFYDPPLHILTPTEGGIQYIDEAIVESIAPDRRVSVPYDAADPVRSEANSWRDLARDEEIRMAHEARKGNLAARDALLQSRQKMVVALSITILRQMRKAIFGRYAEGIELNDVYSAGMRELFDRQRSYYSAATQIEFGPFLRPHLTQAIKREIFAHINRARKEHLPGSDVGSELSQAGEGVEFQDEDQAGVDLKQVISGVLAENGFSDDEIQAFIDFSNNESIGHIAASNHLTESSAREAVQEAQRILQERSEVLAALAAKARKGEADDSEGEPDGARLASDLLPEAVTAADIGAGSMTSDRLLAIRRNKPRNDEPYRVALEFDLSSALLVLKPDGKVEAIGRGGKILMTVELAPHSPEKAGENKAKSEERLARWEASLEVLDETAESAAGAAGPEKLFVAFDSHGASRTYVNLLERLKDRIQSEHLLASVAEGEGLNQETQAAVQRGYRVLVITPFAQNLGAFKGKVTLLDLGENIPDETRMIDLAAVTALGLEITADKFNRTGIGAKYRNLTGEPLNEESYRRLLQSSILLIPKLIPLEASIGQMQMLLRQTTTSA